MDYRILHLLSFSHRLNYQVDLASNTCIIIVIKFNFTATHWIQITVQHHIASPKFSWDLISMKSHKIGFLHFLFHKLGRYQENDYTVGYDIHDYISRL